MKIDQLIYFVETAREEHIGRAAKVLGISASAISHSIASLEGELQIKLFQKKGKNIFLTNEGKKLLDKSQSLITQFKNLKSDLVSENSDKAHYSIAASHGISDKYVVKAWAELQKSYPHTSIDLLTLRSSDVVKSVLSRGSDIGVCFSPQPHPELESLQIYKGELYLNTRKGHPLQKNKSKLDFSELSNYPAVLPKAFEGIDICMQHPMFKKFKITPKPKCLFDSYNISQELLLNTDYWALTPDLFIDNKTCSTLIPPSSWKAPYSISIIWRKHQFTPKFFNDLQERLSLLLKSNR